MINLIPQHARKTVRIEYWARTASVWMFLIGSACLGVVALLVPVWVLITSQGKSLATNYPEAMAQVDQFQQADKTAKDANSTAQFLLADPDSISLTELFALVESYAADSIRINSFTTERGEAGVVTSLVIAGNAARREHLAAFQDALESEVLFASAELPIANLARNEDLTFSITITLADAE